MQDLSSYLARSFFCPTLTYGHERGEALTLSNDAELGEAVRWAEAGNGTLHVRLRTEAGARVVAHATAEVQAQAHMQAGGFSKVRLVGPRAATARLGMADDGLLSDDGLSSDDEHPPPPPWP